MPQNLPSPVTPADLPDRPPSGNRAFNPEHRCPWPGCRRPINRVVMHDDRPTPRPKPGDVSVCFRCAGFLLFGPELEPQRLERSAFLALERSVRLQLSDASTAIAEFWRRTGS